MPFINKLKTDFLELIDNELGKLPVNSVENFTLIVNTLEGIAQPGSK